MPPSDSQRPGVVARSSRMDLSGEVSGAGAAVTKAKPWARRPRRVVRWTMMTMSAVSPGCWDDGLGRAGHGGRRDGCTYIYLVAPLSNIILNHNYSTYVLYQLATVFCLWR